MRPIFGCVVVALLCASACKKSPAPAKPAASTAPTADPRADGTALSSALGDWNKRWEKEPSPPPCADLVKAVEDRRLCTDAAAALERLQAHVKAGPPSAEILKAAAELALTASRAEKKARFLAMEYLGTQGASLAPSASGAVPAASSRALARLAASATPGKAKAAEAMVRSLGMLRDGGAEGPGVAGRDNPYQALVRGYSKLSVQALRYLGVYLEKAPLPLRSAAVGELERLHADHQPWHQLAQVARQAALLERAPDLRARLGKLDPLGGAARRARPAGP